MFLTGAERRRFLTLRLYASKDVAVVWPYLKDHNVIHQGFQLIFEFPNGSSVSCVSHNLSMGGDQGLWELLESTKKGNEYFDGTHKGFLNTRELVENLIEIKERETV
jgi:hypothetical protein